MNPYGYQNQSQYGPPAPPAYQAPPNSYATQLSSNQPQAWNAPNQQAPVGQSWQQFQSQQPQQQQQQQQQQQPPQQPQQQNAAPGYNPGTYGAMPGAHRHTLPTAPAVPQYNAPQYGNTAPPPPPKPPGFNQSNPQQPQNTYYQSQGNQQVQPTYASPPISQPYNNTAPPPPSQTPGGSYFPPSSTPNPNSYGTPQGGIASPVTQPPMSAGGINAQNPAYIPPSLSGQGVASYMPSNTNPLPGVYVPPPPDVPAWTQASQLAPKNKFKYTPAAAHPSYQTNTQGYNQPPASNQGQYQSQNHNQSAYAPVQQPAPVQTTQQWGAQPNMQPQQQDQPNQLWNQPQQSSVHPTPPPQNQGWSTPQQQQQQQQQQQPPSQQSYSQPEQTGNNQGWQAHGSGPVTNGQSYAQNQFPQKEGQPNMSSSQSSFNPVSSPYQEPVSPLSHRQSMSFGRNSVDQGVKRVDSQGLGRKPVGSPASSIRESVSKPPPAVSTQSSTTTGASALGFGGPSDWEHFGAGVEEIDDTAHFGASSTQRPSSPQANISELPSNPSPPPSIAVANDDRPGPATEGWPTPPAPAPANVNRPSSRPPSTLQQAQHVDRFQPTPPPADSQVLGSQSNKLGDDGRSNTPVQRWGPQSIPNSRPGSTASGAQPWQKPAPAGAADPHSSSQNRKSTIADNSGWMSPEQPTPQEYRGGGNLEQRLQPSAPHAAVPPQSFVMDHGPVSPELPANTAHEPTNSQETSKHTEPIDSFTLDSGPVVGQSQQHLAGHTERSKPAEPPKAGDLIPELDPWYTRSLERFIEMLRNEASATAVEDKISIFKSFLAAESHERGVPYYHDLPTVNSSPLKPSDSARLETDFQTELHRSPTQPGPKADVPVISASVQPVTPVDVVEQYSPGGRPIMGSHASITRDQSVPRSDVHEMRENPSVHIDYPTDEVAKPAPLFNGAEAPGKESPANVTYTPYRHNPTQSDSTQSAILTPASSAADEPGKAIPAANIAMDVPPPDLPGFKPYTPAGVETTPSAIRRTSVEVHTRGTSANKRHPEDLFFNQEEPKTESKPISPAAVTPEPPADPKIETPALLARPPSPKEASQPATPVPSTANSGRTLDGLLPSKVPKADPLHPRLTMINNELRENFPPAFTFIAELSKQFDTAAAATRSKNEKARRERQEAEEARTDELFNNNEISYAEIGPLEDNFKAKEANLKAQEDQAEYNEYSEKVFNEIYSRLQKEIGQLMEYRQETLDHLGHGLAARDALEGGEDESHPATIVHAVTTMVALHKALEERYDKVAAAIADRDKRYKKTQVQPLYAAGNIKKLKDLEKHFDSAEKNAALQTREQRAMRLKELFEMVEYNVQRSVEENLDYRHHLLEAVPNSIDADARQLAKETLQVLLDSSTKLMKALGEISRELCNAEFDVEVARVRARPGAVDSAIVKQVEEQGAKEVERVEKDNKERLSVLEDAWKEVDTAFDEREMARRRALDEAKRRNGVL